jgi:hypothetical protein
MDAKKLGTGLILLGIVLMLAAVYWWWTFYAPLAHKLDIDLGRAGSCLYSNGGICSLVSSGAQLVGKTPYNPVLGWIGAVFTGLGIVVKLARAN